MSWPNLTIRLKQRVVDLLDYESRCNLRLSSKDDRDAVDSRKFHPSILKIHESRSEMSEEKTIIRCDMDTLTVWLIGKENLTRIDRGWNGEIVEELSETRQENRYEILNRFLISITNKGVIQAESVEIDEVQFPPPANFKIKTHNLTLHNIENNHDVGWLRISTPISKKFRKLSIRSIGDETELRTIDSVVQVSQSLCLDYQSTFNDEQLEQIEATDLKMASNFVSIDGMRRRLMYFLTNANKQDVLEISFVIPENFNFDDFFPRTLRRRKLEREFDQEDDWYGRIFGGGFTNVHGIKDPWEIECLNFGLTLKIVCKIFEKSTKPCVLYPFYHLRM